MLSWFRQRSRWVSTSALISLITLLAWSTRSHPSDGHDTDFDVVLHNEDDHAVERHQPPVDRPLHCVLCHWTQLVRPPVTTVASFTPSLDGRNSCHVLVARSLQQFQSAQPSLRGPPASPVAV